MSNLQNPIRVYEQDLTLVGELDDYSSAYFTRSWYGAGKFAIQINANAVHASDLAKGRIVVFSRDTTRAGIITDINKKLDEGGKGSQIITATGYELTYIFSWRIVLPATGQDRYEVKNSAETVMKSMVKDQAGSTAPTARQFDGLTVATDQDRGDNYVLSARYNSTVLDELKKCALATGVGYFITVDEVAKTLTFEVGLGVDRTAGQSTNPRAIFSTDYDTLRKIQIQESDVQYRNYSYTAGQGVGSARNVREVYSTTALPEGWDRRETYVDARDLSANADIDLRGAQKLGELQVQKTIDGMPLTYSPLVYRTDYDLGDIVTVSAYGESVDVRITEVKETWAPLSYNIDVTFDKVPMDIGAQVNRAVEAIRSNLSATEAAMDQEVKTTSSPTFARVITPRVGSGAGGGALNLETGGTDRVEVSAAGFTKLGADAGAPGIKVKELTGTTNSTQGTSVTVAHGITNASKIYPPIVSINYSGNSWVNPAYLYLNSGSGGYIFTVEYNDTNVTVANSLNDSSNILSKPFKILIFYKE